jgi:hypothetical protein
LKITAGGAATFSSTLAVTGLATFSSKIQVGTTAGSYTNSTYFTDLGTLGAVINLARPSDGGYTNNIFSYDTAAGKNNLGIASRSDIQFVTGGTAGPSVIFLQSGAATFSSTVSATSINLTSTNGVQFSGSTRLATASGYTRLLSDGSGIRFQEYTGTVDLLLITNAGAATFSGNFNVANTLAYGRAIISTSESKTNTTVTANSNVLHLTTNETDTPFGLKFFITGAASSAARYVQMQTGTHAVDNDGYLCLQPSGGNVGIGTTSPGEKLEVRVAGATISSGNAVNGTSMKGIKITNSSNDNTSTGLWFGTSDSHWSGISGQRTNYTVDWATDLRFYTHEAALTDLTYSRERMRIDSAGNVGIGTTSPLNRLHLAKAGDLVAVFQNTSANTYVYFGNGANRIYLGSDSGTTGRKFSIDVTAPDDVMYVNSSGNLGIGTTSPTSTLHVVGTATISSTLAVTGAATFSSDISGTSGSTRLKNISADATSTVVATFDDSSGGSTTHTLISIQRAEVQVGSITTSNTATGYNTSSDVRLKTNIRDIVDSGAIVDALQPRVFDWKIGDAPNTYGFIAQEVIGVYPQAVAVGDDDDDVISTRWGLDASKLMPIAIAEIKALRARVAALEAK